MLLIHIVDNAADFFLLMLKALVSSVGITCSKNNSACSARLLKKPI